jgi:hypothetical protein
MSAAQAVYDQIGTIRIRVNNEMEKAWKETDVA